VEGPLEGHHHEAYAVRLGADSPFRSRFEWLKLREPRDGIFWYDSRCFRSEEALLEILRKHQVPRVPEVLRVDEKVSVHSFIVGETLGARSPGSGQVATRHLDQIEELFRSLAVFDVRALNGLKRVCDHEAMSWRDDSYGFLVRLIEDSVDKIHASQGGKYDRLFHDLGVPDDALDHFKRDLVPLTPRPYRLLHGDLHRENFIIDEADDLWTIDWELARIGDPLYDLATHLHLMHYDAEQEYEMTKRWQNTVESVLPDAVKGVEADLPQYLAYKRIQSVYTDIIRAVGPVWRPPDEAASVRAAQSVRRALLAATEPLRLGRVLPAEKIASILACFSEKSAVRAG
jgi:fructosamine-3-kinase